MAALADVSNSPLLLQFRLVYPEDVCWLRRANYSFAERTDRTRVRSEMKPETLVTANKDDKI